MKTLIIGGKRWLIKSLTDKKLVAVPAAEDVKCEDLKAERLRLGITQRVMAGRLGISQSSYSKLESGEQARALGAIITLARSLK